MSEPPTSSTPDAAVPDSSARLENVHGLLGLQPADPDPLLPATRRAIERAGYEIQERLSTGATGAVYRAKEVFTGRRVALKVIVDPENHRARKQLERERKVLCADELPGVAVRYHASIEGEDHQPVLVLEFIEGRKIHQASGAHDSLERRIGLCRQMFEELERLHESGLLYGDLSPNNVLVDRDGRVRFVDFGQARRRDPAYRSVNTLSGPRGTPGVATAEVLAGERPPEIQDDLRAAAATAFVVLAGHLPDRDRAGALRASPGEAQWRADLTHARVPRAVAAAILKGLREGSSGKRFARAADLAAALRDWERARAIRRWSVPALAALLVLALTAFLGWQRYLQERRGVGERQAQALMREIEQRPNAAHPAVQRFVEQAGEARKLREGELRAGNPAAADTGLQQELGALRAALGISHALESVEPLRQTLGEVLVHTPWVRSAPTIAAREAELATSYRELGARLDAGDVHTALRGLRDLQRELAQLAADNVAAARAERARLEYRRLERGLSPRLRELPELQAIARRAADAERLLAAGQFTDLRGPGAQTEYGQARAQLERLLAEHEQPEERLVRERSEGALTEELEARILGLERELATLSNELDAQRSARGEAEHALASAREHGIGLESDLRDCTTRTAQLGARIAETEKQSDARAKQAEARIADAEKQLAAATKELERVRADAESWRKAAESSSTGEAERARLAAERRAAENLRQTYAREEAPRLLDELRSMAGTSAASSSARSGSALDQARRIRGELLVRIGQELKEFLPGAPALDPFRAALFQSDALIVELLDQRRARLDRELDAFDPARGSEAALAAIDLARELHAEIEPERAQLARADFPATAQRESVERLASAVLTTLERAGRRADEADHARHEALAQEIANLREERRQLLEVQQRRPESALVQEIDQRIRAAEAAQAPFHEGSRRAKGELPARKPEKLLASAEGMARPAGAELARKLESIRKWAEVLAERPDPKVVTDAEGRSRMEATGLPWKVRDRQSGIVMLLVPPGTYGRGASPGDSDAVSDEKPAHEVHIAEPFYLAETEVTFEQFERFVSSTSHRTDAEKGSGGYTLVGTSWSQVKEATWRKPFPRLDYAQPRKDWPVVQVSWDDAKAFCDHYGLRLPRESEWEYACRSGSTTRYWWGDDSSSGKGKGNFADQSARARIAFAATFPFEDGHTLLAPVGTFTPNAWGFHDLLGNVWEWCDTWYDSGFYGKLAKRSQPIDSKVDDEARGNFRVARGGSWCNDPRYARSSNRNYFAPSYAYDGLGLRAARTP